MNQLIIYGDIHGCYNEFTSLRKKINPQKNDIEVCVGDIVTKGKDSIKTLDFIIEHNINSVLGNHEDKLLRYLAHQKSNKKNPITLDTDEQNIIDNLTNEHIQYLESLPLYLKYRDITIVHGGIQNHLDLDNLSKRKVQNILRLRYLDREENFVAYGKEDETSVFWADIYNGSNGFVVYGHQWFKDVKQNDYSLGIDTGCVYGNKLSAVIFTDNSENYFIESQESSCLA